MDIKSLLGQAITTNGAVGNAPNITMPGSAGYIAPAQVAGVNTNTPSPTTTTTNAGTTQTAAQTAAAANAAKIAGIISTGTSDITSGGAGTASNLASGYQNQAGQLYGQLAQGQSTIDQARKNIGMSQINSIKQLNNEIRQGLIGGAANLSNTNSLDSSASGALARAYSNYGNVQENSINNQAAEGNQAQDVAQNNLAITRDVGMQNVKAFRDNAIQQIQTEAQQRLDSLRNYVGMMGGDGSQVDVDGIKNQILSDAQNKLGAVDGYLQTKLATVNAANPDQTAAAAYEGSNAGVTPSGPGLPFQLATPGTSPADTLGGADNSLIPLALKPRVTA